MLASHDQQPIYRTKVECHPVVKLPPGSMAGYPAEGEVGGGEPCALPGITSASGGILLRDVGVIVRRSRGFDLFPYLFRSSPYGFCYLVDHSVDLGIIRRFSCLCQILRDLS